MASILFAGAAGEVTGSRHLIGIKGGRLLLDCGMFQGHRKEAERKNRSFLFDPKSVDAVILSHAHLDHCGMLPRLLREGFEGRIWCTAATAELAMLILLDSAKIQAQDAAFYNKRHPDAPIEALYHDLDVERCRSRFACVDYGAPFEPLPGVRAHLHEAGHILGSAQVSLGFEEGGRGRSLLFSGDLGRKGMPLLKDPFQPSRPPDALLLESTYGGKLHASAFQGREELGRAVREAAKRGGKVIIPAFAVGRAQELIYDLAMLRAGRAIPEMTAYVDSPMASKATRFFDKHRAILDAEFQADALKLNPFDQPWIRHTQDVEESKAINAVQGPCVIISASGMCESGRILHHLRNHLPDPRNMLLIVGFQAQGTLGRRLVEGRKEVLVYGLPVAVEAEVRVLNEYSAHADSGDLQDFVKGLGRPGKLYLIHGEAAAAQALAAELKAGQGLEARLPALGELAEF